MPVYYADTSALVKLVRVERGTAELRELIATAEVNLVTSVLGKAELLRAVRGDVPEAIQRARAVLSVVDLLAVDDLMVEVAAGLDPAVMRTLDALHVASALALGESLAAIITYDSRMTDAARLSGLKTLSPGA
ncbi:MAG: type II toxin-antitoxin system VapC family toxin [Bifidobacteriaceae bacterium]|jgi:predicted nucleic acid-binding protein|nr:type II toxin-antitoxin system VapC family toxin [Bifidobacteriaceae bacterium]